MTLSRQTFNQVRNILRELDDRISSAREQRTGDTDDAGERKPLEAQASAISPSDPAGTPPGRRSA